MKKNTWPSLCKQCTEKRALWVKEYMADPINVVRYIRLNAVHAFHLADAQLLLFVLMNTCEYCGFHEEGVFLGIDRIDSREGYTVNNCVSCCWRCNFAKGARDPMTFLAQALYCTWAQTGVVRYKISPEHLFKPKPRAFKARSTYVDQDTKSGRTCTLTLDDARSVARFPCHHCKRPFAYVWDRIDNSVGHTMDNVVPSCQCCNMSRKDESIEVFHKRNKRIADRI